MPAPFEPCDIWTSGICRREGALEESAQCDGAEFTEMAEGGNLKGVAHDKFSTPRAALQAVEKLHAHVFKGCVLSVTLKKRVEDLTKAKSGVKTTTTAPSRACRLIVRNLSWNILMDLRALSLSFGPVYSVHIPLASSEEERIQRLGVSRLSGFSQRRTQLKECTVKRSCPRRTQEIEVHGFEEDEKGARRGVLH